MLRKTFLFLLMVFSVNAFACFKVEGSYSVDGETWKFDSKVQMNRETIFPMGPYHLKMTLKPGEQKQYHLQYAVMEKKGSSLSLVTKGIEQNIAPGKGRDIYARGEEGQPHSILAVKLINI